MSTGLAYEEEEEKRKKLRTFYFYDTHTLLLNFKVYDLSVIYPYFFYNIILYSEIIWV